LLQIGVLVLEIFVNGIEVIFWLSERSCRPW